MAKDKMTILPTPVSSVLHDFVEKLENNNNSPRGFSYSLFLATAQAHTHTPTQTDTNKYNHTHLHAFTDRMVHVFSLKTRAKCRLIIFMAFANWDANLIH